MLKVPREQEIWNCPKCGHHGGGPVHPSSYTLQILGEWEGEPERMVLRCKRCGYAEQRLPLDADDV